MDIDFQMMSPKGQLLFNELRSEEGLHEIPNAEEGDYKVSNFPVRSEVSALVRGSLLRINPRLRFVLITTFLE